MKTQLVLLLLALIMLAATSQPVARAQNCGPPANGNKCGNNMCCSQFGYCGSGDQYCGGGCQKKYGKCNGGGSCFPGDALVLMRGGVEKPISEVSIGDEVAVSIGKDGQLQYDEVYANGHTDPAAVSEFVAITMCNGNATKKLQLTPDHFVPIFVSQGNLRYKRAKDVIVGDVMTVYDEQDIRFLVVGLEKEILQGLFNPFTMRGTIVVNNVLASCHSDWFLDSIFDLVGLSHLLPSTYQKIMAPIRTIYKKVGRNHYKSLYNELDASYNIAMSGSHFSGYINLLAQATLSKSNKGGKWLL